MTGKEFLQSKNNIIRSQNFSIKREQNKIIVNGKGFGHQIGLCQRGARELVRQKWPFRKILNFYFPGTKLAKLKETM